MGGLLYLAKRCIESLKNNFYAKYTDLYISVDYPPSEKYVKGYEKVKEYLSIPIDGFREVHCYSMIGPISFNENNYKIGNNYTKQWGDLKSSIIAWMLYFVLFMSGGNREFTIALKKRIKRLLL